MKFPLILWQRFNFRNYMSPFRTLIHKTFILLTLVAFLGCGVSCTSSKKSKKDDIVRIETVKKHKKGKKKGSGLEDRLVDEAMTWMGTPYRYAGSEKGVGTDCSGMVLRVYEDVAGTKLPRNSRKQAEFCRKLKRADVKAGDLVFFATGSDRKVISHVGIMIDDNRFVHASAKKGVILSEMSQSYYERTFIMFGRVPGTVADN